MNIDTNTIVPISVANQNFSKVARLVDPVSYTHLTLPTILRV